MHTFRVRLVVITAVLIMAAIPATAQQQAAGPWHTPEAIAAKLAAFSAGNPGLVKVHQLGKTYQGSDYQLIEIGRETGSAKKTSPAILVVANLEGTAPLASEAALWLIGDLLGKPDQTTNLTWYILACGNPDGAGSIFRKPLLADGRNARPWNDDMDELTDEDGPDDLNGDGFITQMRVKDPDGTMIADDKDPRLMKRADPLKGEKGIWKTYPEGLDNDGDGQYNEDGRGGTNVGITFPFLYGYNQPGTGAWCGSETETYSLMQFMTAHPEIAMTMTYGSTNFCLVPPKGGRKSTLNLSAIRLPQRYAQMLNADPEKTYSLEEVKEMLRSTMPPGATVDDAMVAGMLDMGAVVNPIDADAKLYTALADQYKKYLKEKRWTAKRTDPQREKDGTFELWSLYQLGLPTFSMDLWALPKPKDSLKNAFMVWNDSLLGAKGFVPWKEFSHPVLGKVEIGGNVPFAETLPLAGQVDSLLTVQVPWIYELASKIPRLEIEELRSEPQGAGLYRLTAWIRNTRQLPFPLAIGQRTKVPPPAILTVTGSNISFISGRERTPLEGLGGFEQRKITWIVRAEKPSDIQVRVAPVNAFGSEKTIRIGGN